MRRTLQCKVILLAVLAGLFLGGCSHTTTSHGYSHTTSLPVDDGLFHMRPCTTTE